MVVILGSPRRATSVEIVASRAAPDSSPSHDGAAAAAVPPDTVEHYRSLSDSAARIDATFQRERTALNREALALRAVARASSEYHSRYQAFERRAADAARLRARRDTLRALAAALAARHPEVAVERRSGRPTITPAPAVRRAATSDTTRLALAPGEWWISLSSRPERAVRVEVRAGRSDTVRLR